MTLDGKKQRNALTAAENAISALAAGRPERARRAAAKAADLDQIGAYAALSQAVGEAADSLEAGSGVSEQAWEALATAVGHGPLAALVDQARTSPPDITTNPPR